MAWSQEIPLWEIKDLAKELALRGDSFSVNRGIINLEPVTVYMVVKSPLRERRGVLVQVDSVIRSVLGHDHEKNSTTGI